MFSQMSQITINTIQITSSAYWLQCAIDILAGSQCQCRCAELGLLACCQLQNITPCNVFRNLVILGVVLRGWACSRNR